MFPGRMLGTSIGQRRGVLPASPQATTSCCILRLGNPTGDKTKDPDWTKEEGQSGLPDEKGWACEDQLSKVLPRRLSGALRRKKGNGYLVPKTTTRVGEDADKGRGGRKTGGRKGPISPHDGGAHSRAPKRADGDGATSDGARSEGPNHPRGYGGQRTLETGSSGTKNDRQRDENQILLNQIGDSKDRPDLGQLEPVALWDQRWRRRGATVTSRDLARQISHD